MTRASDKQNPWAAKASDAAGIVPIARFVDDTIFALKAGGYGCVMAFTGVDEEGLTDREIDARVRILEGALRGLPEGACLYQYARIRTGYTLPRRKGKYTHAATEAFVDSRLSFLARSAGFRRLDLHWCLTIEPAKSKLPGKPKENAQETARMLVTLQKAVSILVGTLGSELGLQTLNQDATLQFFSYLFNLEDWASDIRSTSAQDIDRQIVHSPVSWHADHLRVGRRHVQVYSLIGPPAASRPALFSELLALDCDAVLCSTWRPKSAAEVRKEATAQEKFVDFFKAGILQRVSAGRDAAKLETGAAAKASTLKVDSLGGVLADIDQHTWGEYSLRLLIAARSAEEIAAVSPSVHKAFVQVQAPVIEETIGNLSAFYAMFPGNGMFNVWPVWLAENHHARMSLIFAPSLGHVHSADLQAEYLNIFETRTKTPFFQDAYVDGVRVQLIIGPPGTGKSMLANQTIALDQKYGGFTFIFDIGNSYESLVELYGGKVVRIGLDGPRINPFSLMPSEGNLKFLHEFVKLLLRSGGAAIGPEDDDAIFQSVRNVYEMPKHLHRLAELFLPRHLDRYLEKWKHGGVYGEIFDNVEDSLELNRLQCFDFAGISKQYGELIEPLMVWLLRRIDAVVYDPANLDVPKHVVIEELFSNMKNKQLLEGALANIKTSRKNLGGVTLIGQSANDLGENAESIVNSCSSFLFLPDRTFSRDYYGKLFQMTEQQLALFESLRTREALYMRRDGLTKVVTFNLDPRSYAAFSTKPQDRRRRAALVARYGLEAGLDRFAAGETA
ncbi:VirB4 family type IV secretion system protein [Acidipila sp. EB88]|uniref:VirB4 family type IV secretion system protein n=1 Tax=Acidipila sp. EB88 TaxID=2305226 RepID=UPI000F5EE973|nr:VirB4 family type IV secretion system protein [Acidipila sp. EB88]RRA50448.1 type VI secretion protein [Acidipila sp. EB88]